jgi:predicted Zn-dependent protease
MRFTFLVALCVTCALAGTYWYERTKYLCPVPITYRIGTIDEAFGLTPEDARAHIDAAAAVWESTTGRELFHYDPTGTLPINFVFDDRQAHAEAEIRVRKELDVEAAKNDTLVRELEQLSSTYQALEAAYEAARAVYERSLSDYNETVTRYNDQGGAPEAVFQELETQRVTLSKEADALTRQASELAELAATLNAAVDESNRRIEAYNETVSRYNEEFAVGREFTQGDFQRTEINVYKFTNERELVAVLAHEFGHALGIGHVAGTSSIMYYMLEEQASAPELSSEDQAAFVAVCGTHDDWAGWVRRSIRQLW